MSTKRNRKFCTGQATGRFQITESKNGNPQVMVDVVAVDGPDAGTEYTYFGSLSENAAKYTVEALRLMGWKCQDVTALSGLGETKFRMGTWEEEWEGKWNTKVGVWPLKDKPAVDPGLKAKFAANFAALGNLAPPVEVTDANRAGEIPEAKAQAQESAPAADGFDLF